MANLNTPRGAIPLRHLDGSPWNAQVNLYYVPQADTNQYNLGDFVKTAAGGDANGVPQIVKILNGTDFIRGVIVGVLPTAPNVPSLQATPLALEVSNAPAAKTHDYYFLIADDPDLIYEMVDDGINVLTATACNKNASFTVANGVGLSPNSASVITTASIGTVATLNLKLMGLSPSPNNAFGAYARWLVLANLHELGGSATVGV